MPPQYTEHQLKIIKFTTNQKMSIKTLTYRQKHNLNVRKEKH